MAKKCIVKQIKIFCDLNLFCRNLLKVASVTHENSFCSVNFFLICGDAKNILAAVSVNKILYENKF